ncbi:hypothetical protein [Lysobacter humi (ex Lee et al. 2017)]
MTAATCPGCGCMHGTGAHALVGALLDDDVDRAIDLGLLDASPCPDCEPECASRVTAVRDERRAALAARARFRAREARRARRAAERHAAAQAPAASTPASRPALPSAAADALARAMARAKGRA